MRTLISCLVLSGTTALVCAQPTSSPARPSAGSIIPVVAQPAPTNCLGPKIVFATPIADFGKVKSGEVVKHTYYFTNSGDQTLVLTNVAPGCGCTTMGDWTKTVEPGKTGEIPIQLQTAAYNGFVTKFITVTCNDKTHGTTVLQLKGTLWREIEVNPMYAAFNMAADAPSGSTTVTITNNAKEPLVLFPPVSEAPALKAELKTNTPGYGYQLVISASQPVNPGAMQGRINMKTSSTNTPVLSVTAWVNVQPAVMIMPAQVLLPQAPLAAKQTVTLTIQNSSTNAIVLSEPAVSAKAAQVELKELVPGRTFNALLSFPQGFELPGGQLNEFSVKTSNPKHPLVKVPITQLPRPTPPAQPAAVAKPVAPAALPPAPAAPPPAPTARAAAH